MTFSTSIESYQRRIKYIDSRLQGRLIVALMILESVIVSVAMVYLYYDYSALFEVYLYSIHRLGNEDFFFNLMQELFVVVLVMSVFNVFMLIIASSLWVRHINAILSCFTDGLRAINQLDLRSRQTGNVTHEVISELDEWRQRETRRYVELREHLPQIKSAPMAQRLQAIEECLEVLPKT